MISVVKVCEGDDDCVWDGAVMVTVVTDDGGGGADDD